MSKKGFYFYAVRPALTRRGRPARDSETFPKIEGVDKDGKAFPLFVSDGIEAIVSLVPLDQYASEEISHRAQNDLEWIKEKSLLHNQVIMQGMEGTDGAIVPMKFGAIFQTKESLSKRVKKDSRAFLRAFKKLKGKEEWSVKVFARPDVIQKEVIKNDVLLQEKEKEIASLPTGLAYFKEKEFASAVEQRQRNEFQRRAKGVYELLSPFAEEVRVGKILGKELTLRTEPMILNAILFIQKKKLSKFFKKVRRLKDSVSPKGLLVEISGPWPPYNFI